MKTGQANRPECLSRIDEIRLRALDIAARTHSGAIRETVVARAESFVQFVLAGQGGDALGGAAPGEGAPNAPQPTVPAGDPADGAGAARG